MLTPFDDYPIHPGAEPIAHPATGDPNHYDRYFFNGHARDGSFFIGGAMGHYPVRGVIDAALSLVIDGVEHSIFASGRMPLDRSTAVGPISIEVVEPMRTIRLVVAPNEHGITADLTFRARTVAIEEPRQRRLTDDGVLVMDNTRLTQWGAWEGSVTVDGETVDVDPAEVFGTRDRSWGTRPVGTAYETNRLPRPPRVFWLWAPLHFDDVCTHLALHENPDGSRWLQSALLVPLLDGPDAPTYGHDPTTEMADIAYEIEWEPGRREMKSAVLHLTEDDGTAHRIDFEKQFTFRMRGIGYSNPKWAHGSSHGELETGRESIALDDFDPSNPAHAHIQTVCKVTMGDRVGIGVLEQIAFGDHEPTGLTGFFDGYSA